MRNIIIILLLFVHTHSSLSSTISIDRQMSTVLNREKEKEERYKSSLIESIIHQESKGIGNILQINPIMIREVNNILGYEKYSIKDRMDREKSIEMFRIFTDHHTPDWNMELVCRRWNGGYRGEQMLGTLSYYFKVKKHYESRKD